MARSIHAALVALPVLFAVSVAAQEAPRPYLPRHDYGAPLEPPGRIVHGAGQDGPRDDMDGDQKLNGYLGVVGPGRLPAMYAVYGSTYLDWEASPHTREFLDDMAAWEADRPGLRMTPQLGLWIVDYVRALRDGDTTAVRLHEAGLASLARYVERSGRDWFVRIGYEVNGHHNDHDPAAFREAYRRAAAALRGADACVANVWTYLPPPEGDPDYLAWYPGDDHVDWWGVDLFLESDLVSPHVAAFLDDAHARGKPVMVGEATPRERGTAGGVAVWEGWFGPFFDLLRREPGIKAFQYINWDWRGTPWPHWGDTRLEQGPAAARRWSAELSDPVFLHGDLRGGDPGGSDTGTAGCPDGR